MSDDILKDVFALALLRAPNNPFAAAKQVTSDPGQALLISSQWPNDQYVLAKQAELLEAFGEESFLPSKLKLARNVWELTQKEGIDTKDRIKAYELYGNIMSFIAKQTAIANVTNNMVVDQRRVMVVKDHGTDEQWEAKTIEHQTKLLANSRD